MSDLPAAFDGFVGQISLKEKQWARINSAFAGLQEYLAEAYSVSPEDIFVQGSCANGTAIKPPPEGDYDLDIVVVIPNGEVSANAALDSLERILEDNGRYAGKLEPRKPCVRIRYADEEIGGFHIDVVPARHGRGETPLDVPRRGDGWHGTAPREYTAWCQQQGDNFGRTIKSLKRWRDEQQDLRRAVKSIVLQVLVAQCMPTTGSDAMRLKETLTGLQTLLGQAPGPPSVFNPVLPSENLAETWTQDSFNSFRQEIAAGAALATRAYEESDDIESAALWRELLGEDFPLPSEEEAGLALADTSHAQSPASKGWTENLDPRFGVAVTATVYPPNRRKPLARNYSSNHVLKAGWKIRFKAEIDAPEPVSVWWQVVNTGEHAREDQGLRGEFFRAKELGGTPSKDEKENWEDTRYTGAHWIEAFLVRNATVVARSGRLYVGVVNKQRRRAPTRRH